MASKQNKKIEKVVKDLDEMSADENERLEAYKTYKQSNFVNMHSQRKI